MILFYLTEFELGKVEVMILKEVITPASNIFIIPLLINRKNAFPTYVFNLLFFFKKLSEHFVFFSYKDVEF